MGWSCNLKKGEKSMDNLSVKEIIIKKLNETGGTAIIPLMKSDGTFTATYNNEGIQVSNFRKAKPFTLGSIL